MDIFEIIIKYCLNVTKLYEPYIFDICKILVGIDYAGHMLTHVTIIVVGLELLCALYFLSFMLIGSLEVLLGFWTSACGWAVKKSHTRGSPIFGRSSRMCFEV